MVGATDPGFELTAQEVMLGIKVRDGRLVLRPSGLILLGTCVDVVVTTALLVASVVASGGWLVFFPFIAYQLVEALARLRARERGTRHHEDPQPVDHPARRAGEGGLVRSGDGLLESSLAVQGRDP
jgi:hypothetical protein